MGCICILSLYQLLLLELVCAVGRGSNACQESQQCDNVLHASLSYLCGRFGLQRRPAAMSLLVSYMPLAHCAGQNAERLIRLIIGP